MLVCCGYKPGFTGVAMLKLVLRLSNLLSLRTDPTPFFYASDLLQKLLRFIFPSFFFMVWNLVQRRKEPATYLIGRRNDRGSVVEERTSVVKSLFMAADLCRSLHDCC